MDRAMTPHTPHPEAAPMTQIDYQTVLSDLAEML
jgi:hypothetical protein